MHSRCNASHFHLHGSFEWGPKCSNPLLEPIRPFPIQAAHQAHSPARPQGLWQEPPPSPACSPQLSLVLHLPRTLRKRSVQVFLWMEVMASRPMGDGRSSSQLTSRSYSGQHQATRPKPKTLALRCTAHVEFGPTIARAHSVLVLRHENHPCPSPHDAEMV